MFKILVIDDSSLMRKIVRDHLEDAGFEVDDFLPNSAEELINHLNKNQPDVVISDFNMPKLNGEAVARAIRFSNPKIPIIILTANRDAARDHKLKSIGVRRVLYKPISGADLVGAVVLVGKQQRQPPND